MEQQLRNKAEDRIHRLQGLEESLQNPETMRDRNAFTSIGKEIRELQKLKDLYTRFQAAETSFKELGQILNDPSADPELTSIAQEESTELEASLKELHRKLSDMLVERDPADAKNAVVEVRAGTGGAEASLFASEIYRMYARFASDNGFKLELISQQLTELGGLRECIFLVEGDGAYGKFKFESGVHRVQRVPETEASGRIHTSAVTVAVLPEAEDVEVDIKQEELKIDVFRSGGPGGQSVNTTDSAVRITHLPTGLVVTCQDEKSQLKNKNKAMKVLRARLADQIKQERESAVASERKSQVGSGDRSEKIRTYNFPERRVTDHRISLTLHRLEQVLDGELTPFIDALALKERELKQ